MYLRICTQLLSKIAGADDKSSSEKFQEVLRGGGDISPLHLYVRGLSLLMQSAVVLTSVLRKAFISRLGFFGLFRVNDVFGNFRLPIMELRFKRYSLLTTLHTTYFGRMH